ncbi:MAG: protoheme IX farnesyltransferase [Candidatus Kapaibacteriales bacterium]
MKFLLKNYFVLTKFRITFSVVLTAILGYILYDGYFDVNILPLILGVYFLSSGASALNQTQEWRYDALMKRTRNRPIPRNLISPEFGFVFSQLSILLGVAFLIFFSGKPLPSILGLLAVVFYNLVYTPLKRLTPFSAIPGALIGAIPPMIGWTFAGGEFFHPQNLVLALFFFLWQVPHFWLLLLVYEDDYLQAGFPILTQKYTKLQIARISFIWIISMVFCAFAIPFLESSKNPLTSSILLIVALLFLSQIFKVIRVVQPATFYKKAFIQLNAFVLVVMIVIAFNRFVNF